MKLGLLSLLIILFNFFLGEVSSLYSQNLVQNYSFENYLTCNNFFYDTSYTKWYSTKNTPDYLSICFSNNIVGVPLNMSGLNYQLPKTGNSYIGILTYNESVADDREYFSNVLVTPLLNNIYYNVKFYVVNSQCSKYASDIQLSFTSNLSFTSTAGFIALPPHIYEFKNIKITDTLNWVAINGIYKANGTEQYITIGNFKNDLLSKVDTTNYNIGCTGAYYFIDDVSVEPIYTPFWSYRDTAVAIGDSVLIGPAITGLNINWYDASGTFITNAPGIYVKPNSPTFYTATEDFCGSTVSHTIHVTVSPLGLVSSSEVENSLKISPNPTDGVLRISTSLDVTDLSIKITDVLGKEALVSDYKEQIDISFLENDIYFLSMYKNNQLLITKKVVKQ